MLPGALKSTKLLTGLFAVVIALVWTTSCSAADPYSKANNSWISINGVVRSVSSKAFNLDYGDGIVTVEMDGDNREKDAYKLMPGDKVTVRGRIDADEHERTSIEANVVYIEKNKTFLHASSRDDEDHVDEMAKPVVISETVLVGLVTDVDEHEFTLDAAGQSLTVDAQEMSYNPLHVEGFGSIKVGNLVRVTGRIDRGFFDHRELVAESVTKLLQ